MISHEHKFIFIHTPKTAGSSIRMALDGKYDELHKPHHSGIESVKKQIQPEMFEVYFKFAFVRNPWDREVSRYHFIQRYKDPKNALVKFCQTSFREYILAVIDRDVISYDTLKINGEYALDFIGKFENLQQDFNIVCNEIGIQQQSLPHIQKSTHKHYTEYYDDETRETVAQKYAEDIEYFDYKFGE
tara:strand:- start:157 stop:717 length:561 start_codon:yes stop_codon:yes gene_type:complete